MSLHIYAPVLQPATDYIDECGSDTPYKGGYKPYEPLYSACCGKKRYAIDLNIQCRYDGYSLWCKPGLGCKDPAVIAAKKQQEFVNRSNGQKKRAKMRV